MKFDMTERALDALPSRYNKDNFVQAFAHAVGAAAQLVENAAHDVLTETRLDNAEGRDLDAWGDIVGENRGNLNDLEYRQIILGKIASSRSYGTPSGVETSITNLYNPDTWQIDRYPSASVYVQITDTTGYSDDFKARARALLIESFPTGVSVYFDLYEIDNAFQFDRDAPHNFDNGEYA